MSFTSADGRVEKGWAETRRYGACFRSQTRPAGCESSDAAAAQDYPNRGRAAALPCGLCAQADRDYCSTRREETRPARLSRRRRGELPRNDALSSSRTAAEKKRGSRISTDKALSLISLLQFLDLLPHSTFQLVFCVPECYSCTYDDIRRERLLHTQHSTAIRFQTPFSYYELPSSPLNTWYRYRVTWYAISYLAAGFEFQQVSNSRPPPPAPTATLVLREIIRMTGLFAARGKHFLLPNGERKRTDRKQG